MRLNRTSLFIAGMSAVAVLTGSFGPALSKCVMQNPLLGVDVYMEDKYCPPKKVKKKAAGKKIARTKTPNSTVRRNPKQVVVTKQVTAPKPEKRITDLQTMLTSAGYNPGPVDGINGPMTREAAAKFNLANDLPEKASIGSTNAVLAHLLAPKPDRRILEMQAMLSKMGYYSGPVDGHGSTATQKAAGEFNIANELPRKASLGSTIAVLRALMGNS